MSLDEDIQILEVSETKRPEEMQKLFSSYTETVDNINNLRREYFKYYKTDDNKTYSLTNSIIDGYKRLLNITEDLFSIFNDKKNLDNEEYTDIKKFIAKHLLLHVSQIVSYEPRVFMNNDLINNKYLFSTIDDKKNLDNEEYTDIKKFIAEQSFQTILNEPGRKDLINKMYQLMKVYGQLIKENEELIKDAIEDMDERDILDSMSNFSIFNTFSDLLK